MTKFYPNEFAAAYIQTLPHAKKLEEFKSRSDYHEYLKRRRHAHFIQYLEAIEFAESFASSDDDIEAVDS